MTIPSILLVLSLQASSPGPSPELLDYYELIRELGMSTPESDGSLPDFSWVKNARRTGGRQDDDRRRKRLSHPPSSAVPRDIPERAPEFHLRVMELRRRAAQMVVVGDPGKIRELLLELEELADVAEMQAAAIEEAGSRARESAEALRWVLEHGYERR